MAVFYQTYRPQNFLEVIGQEAIVKTLQQAVASGKIGHAYLFTGSRGIGKTTLARILAKAANCNTLKDGNPCGICDICLNIANGSFLDVIEIDAASHTGVDNIRELIEHIRFQPSQGRTKVFVIDEVHMLSKAAFNALLKTLEEPPSHVLFILATTDIEKVPDTIISRTQRFDFRKITTDQIKKALQQIVKVEKLSLPEEAIDVIVENSEGGLRDALSQLSLAAHLDSSAKAEDIHLLLGTTSRSSVLELLNLISEGKTYELNAFFNKLTQANFDAVSFARKTLVILQEHLEANLSASSDGKNGANDLIASLSLAQLLYIIRLFMRAYKEIDKALTPELPLLMASIEAALFIKPNSTISVEKGRSEQSSSAATASVISTSELVDIPIQKQPVFATENIEPEQDSDLNLTAEQVKEWWPGLVAEVKAVNSPLSTLLKNSPIHEVSGNRVSVMVRYLFHKEHLENAKIRVMISNYLGEKAGGNVEFRVVIQKDSVGEQIVDTASAVSDAIKIFGGELVE